MDKSFRIKAIPGVDQNLIVKLEQKYDTLEVLSLKLSQDNLYRTFSSDYGVIIGRVLANSGLGVPNAKVSVFIPISDDDFTNPLITKIYPFQEISDKTSDGVRYNLITPKPILSGVTNTGIYGTFPSKQQFLDDDTYVEVYEKYYKFTTVTNNAGDYMIFGVPTGQQTIHMDTDLSDIGPYSFSAAAMVANGLPKSLFNDSDNTFTFKGGTGLDQLPQIISQNISVNVIPLWGDTTDTTLIGITRLDFNINILVSPVAYITFAVGYDTQHLADGIYTNDSNPLPYNHIDIGDDTNVPGYIGRFQNNPLQTINAYEYDANGNELTFDPTSYQIVSSTDDVNKGIYMILLPCNLNKVITDEYGNLIPSNSDKGIGTTGQWRIEVYSNNGAGIINYLLQKNSDAEPFILRSNRIYSVKFQMFDAFTLKDDGYRNIYDSLDELPMFNAGDWLNGFLYFGYGHFDKSGSAYPGWLDYKFNNNSYYNVQTRVIDVTDYIDNLIDGGDGYFGGYNFKFFTDAQLPPNLVTNLKADNSLYGDSNSGFAPSTASAFSNRYVFYKGATVPTYGTGDCFAAIKNYINQ